MKNLLVFIFLSGQLLAQNKTLTLQDAMLNRSLYPTRLVNAQWLSGTDILAYCTPNYQHIISKNSQGKADTLIKLSDINALLSEEKLRGLWGITWVDAQTIYFEVSQVGYRYDRVNKRLDTQFNFPQNGANTDYHHASGKAAFTVDNNLFMAVGDRISPVTQHTDKNFVAGQAIARSEFGITKGTFWSNSGKYLAFYEKDESYVSDYPLLDITTTPGSLKNIKYPMAGHASEIPAIGIFNTENQQLIYLKTESKQPDDYLTNLGWDPTEKFVYVAEVNRDQNHMKLNKYDAATGAFVATLFEEKNERYVEPETAPYFALGNATEFVWLSERDGFMNLYLYNTSGKLIRQLTKNTFPTKEIIGSDKQFVYFTATGTNATETHLFKVDIKNGKQTQLTKSAGTHSATLSSDGKFFLDELNAVDVAYLAVMRQTKDGHEHQSISAAGNPLKNYACPKPELLSIKAKDGTLLHGRIFKPTVIEEGKKYPVIIYVYGGPHAQMVTNSYNGGAPLWMNVQAEKGYIIFTVDGRGSAHRGFAFESIIHRNLGDIEMSDQIDGVAYLKSLPYVDADKIAVHGWSYGGFMTTSLMLHHPETFKVGVAGGPVTDWKYYEIMYGERYMDRPEQNPEGYKKTALANHVKNLKGDLLLIHGTADDVVVMQHNFALVKAFIDAGVQVDFFPYPMHPHNVRGKDRLHLMQKVLGYIEERL